MEADKNFLKEIIGGRIPQKDSMLYTIAPHAGKGTMLSFQVMPGVEVIYNDFELLCPVNKVLQLNVDCIEITYCRHGHIEIEFANHKYAYLMAGDLSLFGYRTDVVSCDFSAKPCVGITVMAYLPDVIRSMNIMLGTNEFSSAYFLKNVFTADTCIVSHATQSVDHIFKELFVLPDTYKNYFMKTKVIELLLYLMQGTDYKENEKVYFSKSSVDKIKAARRLVLQNLDKHITLQKISQTVGMNRTDLEKGFKSIYGSTVFAYSKAYKLQKAKELLWDTDLSILEVALSCGYGSGSKFAKAFQDVYGMSPLQYRQSHPEK